tara:strand:- start:992 stop:1672 length:681 start_codon:yes stop_codon:yes gene_type:complete
MAPSIQRAVLFDLDGTVVHTAPDLAGAANDMRQARGLPALPEAELAPFCSYGGRGMIGKAFERAPGDADYDDLIREFMTTYEARMTRASHPYAGIRELVAQLAADEIRWGIVTNKPEYMAVPLMEHLAFDPAAGCVIGGDTAGVSKPDPAPIHLACERMGLAPAHCIYIGDSDRDIAAGRAAGMSTVTAGYGYIPAGEDARAWPADRHVAAVDELREAITSLLPKR